eukprot:m.25362 g.25362  ORF g.25362 m.25362 type:complete len:275 (+) comp7699_c0_seq3:203-1027(+)
MGFKKRESSQVEQTDPVNEPIKKKKKKSKDDKKSSKGDKKSSKDDKKSSKDQETTTSTKEEKESTTNDPQQPSLTRAERRALFWEEKQKAKLAKRAQKEGKTETDVAEKNTTEENTPKVEKSAEKPRKKRKLDNPVDKKPTKSKTSDDDKGDENPEEEKKKRYILFVGNMSFQTKLEHIWQHFGRFGGLTDVRVLTDKKTKRPKGICFVEYDNRESHNKALGLHQTKMCGRVINVELTVGGGGSGENRKQRLDLKNNKLKAKSGANAIPLGKRK